MERVRSGVGQQVTAIIHILAGDLTRCETSTVSTDTAVAWLAHIRFIEERVVGVHAMDNEKYRNVNSGVIAQVFDQYI